MVRWPGISRAADARTGCIAPASLERELTMSIRWSRVATGMLVVTIVVLMSDQSWAIREKLGPSKDEWGLKYDVAVRDADGDKVTVVFTLADEGRLKPFYSLDLVAFSIPKDSRSGSTYDVN